MISRRNAAVGGIALVTLLVSGLAGCRSGTSTAGAGSLANSTPTAVAPSPGASTSGLSPSPAASPILADGRSPVYLTTVDPTHGTVTFDLIQFLTGDAAKAAWKKANPDSQEDGPDNDYYIVNDNPKLRTLPVAAAVTITVLQNDGGSPDPMSVTFANLPSYLQDAGPDVQDHRLSPNPFWLTVKNGTVTKIEEQFVP